MIGVTRGKLSYKNTVIYNEFFKIERLFYQNSFSPIWKISLRQCLFIVFSRCYLVYHRVHFLVLWFTHFIHIPLGSLHDDIALNITCMQMTHSCIYIYIYIYIHISLEHENETKFPSSLDNLENCIVDIQVSVAWNLLIFNHIKTTIICFTSSFYIKSHKTFLTYALICMDMSYQYAIPPTIILRISTV